MPTTRGANWRAKIIEHVATIANSVSATDSGAAHTVQRMLDNPTFRRECIDEALRRSNPGTSGVGTSDWYQRVQNAADALRGYEGARI